MDGNKTEQGQINSGKYIFFLYKHVFGEEIKVTQNNWMSYQAAIAFQSYNPLNKVPEAQASIKIIFEHAITKAKQAQLQNDRKRFSSQVLAAFYAIKMLKLRRYHYPVQYLLGKWYFRDLELTVKPPILIPRFETEHLVEISIEAIRSKWQKGCILKFIDLGCGTGAIGLSLMKELQKEYSISGILLDLNPACVELAKKNAVKNNISLSNINFVCGDMIDSSKLIDESNIVISNPPYLKSGKHRKLQKQVRIYEAHEALVGGQDGLDLIRHLVTEVKRQKEVRTDFVCFIEYGGEDVSLLEVQQYVKLDQYGRRRYLMFT